MPALIKPARQNQVFCTTVDRNGGWQSQLRLSSTISSKPNGLAGIQLDGNAATGDFLLSLSPANLTAARRWSFPDRSDTVAGLGAQTFTGAQTIGTVQISGTSGAGFKITAASGYGFVALNDDMTFSGTCGFFGGASGDSNLYLLAPTGFGHNFRVNNVTAFSVTGALATSVAPLSITDTTASTSTTTGALVVTGGVGIGGRLNVGGALEVSSATLIKSNTTLTNGAAAAAGTLLNAPAAGNPTKWFPINDNGTTRYVPAW